jgi:predicted Zn finger-like uncharacterized protein
MLVTTCPECETTFRISVGILEKAGGQVRCGRCAKIFDANVDLHEIDDAEAAPSADSKIQIGLKAEPAPSPDVDDSGDSPEEAADEADDAAVTDGSDAGSTPDADADADADAERDGASSAAVHKTADAPNAQQPTGRAGADLPDHPNGTSDDEWNKATGNFSSLPDWLRPVAQAQRHRSWPWTAGAAVLCVTLAAQLTHRFRNELVSVPVVGTVLELGYSVAGIDLVAPVDLDQFDLLDLTALAEPADEEQGWLIIETRVRNKGPKVQPYPHIFVRLLDRWEDTVAGRYFAPSEYTVSTVADYSSMNIGTTVDAQFIIMDPGPSATGFELELCTKIVQGFVCESGTNFQ